MRRMRGEEGTSCTLTFERSSSPYYREAVRLAGRDEAEGTERHVTGQELLQGMRAHALDLFGPMAAQVWRSWGISETLDWGNIVFLLVEAKLLNRQETDTIEDFRAGFDFDEAFVQTYRPKLPPHIGPSIVDDDG